MKVHLHQLYIRVMSSTEMCCEWDHFVPMEWFVFYQSLPVRSLPSVPIFYQSLLNVLYPIFANPVFDC